VQDIPAEQGAELNKKMAVLKTYLQSSAQLYKDFQSLQDEKQREQEFSTAFDRYRTISWYT
jgi:hypothetical protein